MPRKAIVPREATPSATPTQQSQDGTAVLREAARERRIHLQPRIRRAFVALPGRILERPERRSHDGDRGERRDVCQRMHTGS